MKQAKIQAKIQKNLEKMYDLYEVLLDCIDNEVIDSRRFKELITKIENDEFQINKHDNKIILYLLSSLSKNHHRTPGFFDKITKIISCFTQKFTDDELIEIFKGDKLIMLFLLKNKMVSPEKYYNEYIQLIPDKYQLKKFFYPEFKNFLNEQIDDIDNFESKRQEGENESYICSLIRNDSVETFIQFTTRKNISLSIQISESLFETNEFLIGKKLTLIEYAAFYGSIKIFNYLYQLDVAINPSLWIYAFHSNNPELIHRLEELDSNNPMNPSYEECFIESIKCHHNGLANYLFCKGLIYLKNKNYSNISLSCKNLEMFKLIEQECFNPEILKQLIIYDYYDIVEIFMKEGLLNWKTMIILKKNLIF